MGGTAAWKEAVRGKVVLITGPSRGIGAATARLFAASGAKLGLAGRPSPELSKIAVETKATLVSCDVTSHERVEAAVQAMVQAHGRLDVMINNAGVIAPIGQICDTDPALWSQNIDVNLKGVYYGMRAALPVMKAQGSGTIISIGSGAAYSPLEGWSAYNAAKAGSIMLTRAAHLEAGRTVRVMSLSPGTVATDMQRAISASGINPVSQIGWESHVPPEWPAKALLWMCSAEADPYRGGEVALRDPDLCARLGLES